MGGASFLLDLDLKIFLCMTYKSRSVIYLLPLISGTIRESFEFSPPKKNILLLLIVCIENYLSYFSSAS